MDEINSRVFTSRNMAQVQDDLFVGSLLQVTCHGVVVIEFGRKEVRSSSPMLETEPIASSRCICAHQHNCCQVAPSTAKGTLSKVAILHSLT